MEQYKFDLFEKVPLVCDIVRTEKPAFLLRIFQG